MSNPNHLNQRRVELQAVLGHPGSTKRLERLTTRRINHYLHAASKAIIVLLVREGIGTLVIGKNPLWKQEVELGRVNNQHFVQIPHARFIQMLEYKSRLAGIGVLLQEESYTSKASFLDLDPLPDTGIAGYAFGYCAKSTARPAAGQGMNRSAAEGCVSCRPWTGHATA
jgi:putative transposase